MRQLVKGLKKFDQDSYIVHVGGAMESEDRIGVMGIKPKAAED